MTPAADTMRALWLEDGQARLRDDVPVPGPPAGEALVRVEDLVEARYQLDHADKALEHARRKGALKVLLEME